MTTAVRSALLIVICLLAAACASAPAPRPLASGFGSAGGVADPYADGKRHLAAGNYELAVQRFGQALAHDGRSLDALNGLGIAYTRLRRFDSAETQYERALQIEPTNAATLNNYGWSLIEQGRLREARAFLELARRHATASEAAVIAANLENLGQARPPTLLGALEAGSVPQAPRGPRGLIRVDDNAYRLETTTEPAEPPAPPRTAPDAPLAAKALAQDTSEVSSSEAAGVRPDAPLAAEALPQDTSEVGSSEAAGAPPDAPLAAEALPQDRSEVSSSEAAGAPPDAPLAAEALPQDTSKVGSSEAAGARLDAPSSPSVTAQRASAPDALPAPAERSRAAEPGPDVPTKPHSAGGRPIRLWPPLAPGPEVGPITPGDER